MAGASYLPMIDPTTILLKGYLLKENWYGNKQKRYFELYPEGIIKYFEIKTRIRIYKSCLNLGPTTVLHRQLNSLRFVCYRKNREYVLFQPPQAKIGSFSQQQAQGNCSILDRWQEEMQKIIDQKKKENPVPDDDSLNFADLKQSRARRSSQRNNIIRLSKYKKGS